MKNPEDLNSAIETLTKVMQQAALQSTLPLASHKSMNNTPLEIKEPTSQPIKPDITS
jgi:hypothetical protein